MDNHKMSVLILRCALQQLVLLQSINFELNFHVFDFCHKTWGEKQHSYNVNIMIYFSWLALL